MFSKAALAEEDNRHLSAHCHSIHSSITCNVVINYFSPSSAHVGNPFITLETGS